MVGLERCPTDDQMSDRLVHLSPDECHVPQLAVSLNVCIFPGGRSKDVWFEVACDANNAVLERHNEVEVGKDGPVAQCCKR